MQSDKQELGPALARQINEAHARCMSCDAKIVGALVEKINHGREAGIALQVARDHHKRPADWEEWVRANLDFSESSAERYLYVARKLPDGPIDDSNHQFVFGFAKPLAIATGELAAPDGHGEQAIHSPSFLSYVSRQLNNFKGEYEKQIRKHPIHTWTRTAREQLVVQLEPVAKDIEEWIAEARNSLTETDSTVERIEDAA